MNIRLEGKRALVTGGNSGLGAAIALALAEAGAKVAINYMTHPEAADALIQTIKQKQGEAISIQTDVSDPKAVREMFRQMDAAWSGLDILINNAGMDGPRAMGWEADIEAWRKVIEVNLFGSFYCAREALKHMVAQKSGVVLSTTSVHEENRLVRLQRLHGQQGGREHVDQDPGPGSGAARSARAGGRPGGHQNLHQPLRLERSKGPAKLAGENPAQTDGRA
jgi:NAD(P)-dependent dehydrogenase (short-subunit alcohol dehydrogenase family)